MTEFTYPTDTLDTKQDLMIHSPNSTLTSDYIPINSYSDKYIDSYLDSEPRNDPRTVTKMKAFIKSYYSCDSFLPPLDLSKVAEYSCSGILSKDDLKRFFHPDIIHHGSDMEDGTENELETGADLAANLLVQAKILHQRAMISEDKAKVVEQELADANLELKKTSQRYQALNTSHQEMRDQFWDLELHIQGLNSQIHNLISTNQNLTEENQLISRKLAVAMENLSEIKDRETELMESLDAGMKKYDQDTAELHRTILKMHEDINLLERQSIPIKPSHHETKAEFQSTYSKSSHEKSLDYATNYFKPSPEKNKDYQSIYSTPSHENGTDHRSNFNKVSLDRSPEYNTGYSSSNQEKSSELTYSKPNHFEYHSYERGTSPHISLPEELPQISPHSKAVSPQQSPYSVKYETALSSPDRLEQADSVQPLQKFSKRQQLQLSPHLANSKERTLFRTGSLADSGYDGSNSYENSFSYESDMFHPALQSSDDETSSAIRPFRVASDRQPIRLSETLSHQISSPPRSQRVRTNSSQHEYHHRSEISPTNFAKETHRKDAKQKLTALPNNKTKERPMDCSNLRPPSQVPNYHIRTYHVPARRKAKGLKSNWEILTDEFNEPNSRKLASRVLDLGDRVLVQEILKGNGIDSDQEDEVEEEEVDEEIEEEFVEEDPEDKEEVISIKSIPSPVPSKGIPYLASPRLTSAPSIISLRGALDIVPQANNIRRNGQTLRSNSEPLALHSKTTSITSPLKSIQLTTEPTPLNGDGYLSDVAQAVQHVMVGEFLYKSTRSMLGQEKRALKFVWLNPQAKYLYWCDVDPGTQRTLFMDPSRPRSGAKSAFISSVRLISDGWVPAIPSGGVSPYNIEHFPTLSIVIDTPRHNIKLKARSESSHKLWETALFYLQSTVPTLLTSQTSTDSVSSGTPSIKSGLGSSPERFSPESPTVMQGIQRGHFVPSSAKQNRLSMLSPRGTW